MFGFTFAAPGPRVVAYLKRQKAREASVSGAYGVIRVDDALCPYTHMPQDSSIFTAASRLFCSAGECWR